MDKNISAKICGPCGKEFTPTIAGQLYCSKECKGLGESNHKRIKKIEARIGYLYGILNRKNMNLGRDFTEKANAEIEKLRKKKAAIKKRF